MEALWTEDDVQNDDNMFLVEKKLNNGASETLFIMVQDGIIAERDCITGKTIRSHDLKILSTAEYASEDQLTIKLVFDSRILSKQTAEYVFDSEQSLATFKENHLLPFLLQRRQELFSRRKFYECLKCGLNKLSETPIEKCPKCGSSAFMEMEQKSQEPRSGSDFPLVQSTPQSSVPTYPPQTPVVPYPSDVWKELVDSEERYDLADFDSMDHQLKLLLAVELFADDEEFRKCFRCRFFHKHCDILLCGYFVISSQKIYLFSYDGDEVQKDPILNKPVSSLRFLKPVLDQGVSMEWTEDPKPDDKGKNKVRSCAHMYLNYVVIIFDDSQYCKVFVNYLKELKVTIEDLAESEDTGGTQFVKCVNYYGEEWPMVLSGSEEGSLTISKPVFRHSEVTFEILEEEEITDIVAPLSITSDFKQVTIQFQNEMTNSSNQWTVDTFSRSSMRTLLMAVKTAWEDSFAVPLLLCKID